MLRDKNLIPLSRQHQHALALCVRIDRASPIPEPDLPAWQTEIGQHFRAEIRVHFDAEERLVFPAAQTFSELASLVDELLAEHKSLRERFAKAEAQSMGSSEITRFAQELSAHIRKEERGLFERLQELMKPDELHVMGQGLEEALKEAEQACTLPAKSPREL